MEKDYKDLDEQPAPPIPESKLVAPEPQLPKKKSLIEEVEVDIDVEDKSEKKEKKDKKEKKEKKDKKKKEKKDKKRKEKS